MRNRGSIFKLKKRNAWAFDFYHNGKRRRIQAQTKQLLLKKIDELQRDIYQDKYIQRNDVTIPELLHYNNERSFKLNQIQPSTYNRNKSTIKTIENTNLANIPIQDVTMNTLDKFSMSMLLLPVLVFVV